MVYGDTLWNIASKNGLTVSELKSLNNLTSNSLSIGQTLKLSNTASSTTSNSNQNYYIVKSGDTLYSIARKYNLSVSELKSLNNLSTNNLSVGQKLIVTSPTSDNAQSNETVYTVKSGDNLYSIAQKYGTTVSEIKSKNNLTSNLISVNQKLIIPKTQTVYTVKSGDTLYSIANKNNTTVDKIKSLNNLTTNTLSINQKLLLP